MSFLNKSQRDVLAQFNLGIHVARATSGLPVSTTMHLFTVSVGRVMVNMLLGTVTTAIQSSDPVAKLTCTPTAGTAVDVASTVTLASLEVGGWIACAGDGTAMVVNNAGASLLGAKPGYFMCNVGTIDLITTATKTGQVKWDLWYVPLDDGATIVAA